MSALHAMIAVSKDDESWTAFTQFCWRLNGDIDGGMLEMPSDVMFNGHLRRLMKRTEHIAAYLDTVEDEAVKTGLHEVMRIVDDILYTGKPKDTPSGNES